MDGVRDSLPGGDDGTTSNCGSTLLYCGYKYDPETGLYYSRNRYYHCTLATWISRDPARVGNNLYQYCDSGPTGAVDPTGNVPVGQEAAGNMGAWNTPTTLGATEPGGNVPIDPNTPRAVPITPSSTPSLAGDEFDLDHIFKEVALESESRALLDAALDRMVTTLQADRLKHEDLARISHMLASMPIKEQWNPILIDSAGTQTTNAGVGDIIRITASQLAQNAKQAAKQAITDSITATADWVFNQIETYKGALTPEAISAINAAGAGSKTLAAQIVDTNPRTMGWGDLTFAWFFELGGSNDLHPVFRFGPNDATTGQLRQHEGVNQAREKAQKLASQMAQTGKLVDHVDHDWDFGVAQAWTTLAKRDTAAAFLGSYHTHVDITRERQKDGSYKITYAFTASNTTGWESGTRFRKAAKEGGQHQGILKDRDRRSGGIEFGGTIKQEWTWTENN